MITERLAECGTGPDIDKWSTSGTSTAGVPWYGYSTSTDPTVIFPTLFSTASRSTDCTPGVPSSPHGVSGIVVCMGDASNRLVNTGISLPTWQIVNSPTSNAVTPSDW
jgi:hypothetical protein